MKRYYLSLITGDGTDESPREPALAQYGVNYVVAAAPPGVDWLLALVAATNHAPLLADASLYALPDLSLDSTLSALTNQQYNALTSALSGRGVPGTTRRQDRMRDVLRRIGRHLDGNFDENRFDVSE